MNKTIRFLLAAIMIMIFIGGCTAKIEDNNEGKVVDINEIHKKIKDEFGDNYIPNMNLNESELENMIGVKKEDIDEYIAEVPMMSVNVDTFIAIKAKEGKADNIEESLNNYRKSLVENSMQYPMNQAKVNGSKVVKQGDYIFFIMIGKYDDRDDITEEEALDFAKEEVSKVEDIINNFFK